MDFNQLTTNIRSKFWKKEPAVLPYVQLRKLGLIFCSYRFIISLFLFLTSYTINYDGAGIVVKLPSLLQQTTLIVYSIFSFCILIVLVFIQNYLRRLLGISLVIDIITLSFLLFINGAPDLQLTMLFMVVVAAGFMLLAPYQAAILTMLAIILVIYQELVSLFTKTVRLSYLGDSLLLALSFIGVGLLSWSISQRLAQVEQIASINEDKINKLNTINLEVIRKINNGVFVMDKNKNVIMHNSSAIELLNIPNNFFETTSSSLNKKENQESHQNNILSQYLHNNHGDLLNKILSKPQAEKFKFVQQMPGDIIYDLSQKTLRFNITQLDSDSLLVIIEDVRQEQTKVQQLKLAALGQLTASIAHEIRNPLAAISQASQLLIEDYNDNQSLRDTLPKEQRLIQEGNNELYQMIFKQTQRVNKIIENVLNLSKQSSPTQDKIDITQWLQGFVQQHFANQPILIISEDTPQLYFDPNHLEQIFTNLITNALKFSNSLNPLVEVEILSLSTSVIVNVLDNGDGVLPSHQSSLFMPFYTTDNKGTGLGLYLSQSFAEANHAQLYFVPEHPKTCFRLLVPKASVDNNELS